MCPAILLKLPPFRMNLYRDLVVKRPLFYSPQDTISFWSYSREILSSSPLSSDHLSKSWNERDLLKSINHLSSTQHSATEISGSRASLNRSSYAIFKGTFKSQQSCQNLQFNPFLTLKMAPHLKKCFTLCKPFQNCELPLLGAEKKEQPSRYLGLISLNHNSSGSCKIIQIHLTSKQSFLVLVLIMPRPPGL